ncbi:MAG TPA: hypothetical protein VLB67_02555 [Acidimicrobiia bacterium]|nr:hypothetical protein [Acidimicrobiia bacterium]
MTTSPRSVADQDGESLESIPWESLHTLGQPADRRHWYAVAGAIVLAAVLVSVVRVASPDTPVDLSVPAVTAATVPTAPSIAPPTTAVTEADLMSVDAGTVERVAVAVAETAALAYFSQDVSVWEGVEFDRSRSTFVEYVSAVSVVRLAPARFEVVVAVSVLDGVEGSPFQRRPLRGVSLVVDGTDGDFRPVDLPSPAVLPMRAPGMPAPMEESPVPGVMESVARLAAPFGEVVGEPLSFGRRPSGEIRVVAAVMDPGGMTWPMSFDVSAAGVVLPSG